MPNKLLTFLVNLFTRDLDTIANFLQTLSDRIEALILSQAEEIGQLQAQAEDLLDAAEQQVEEILAKANVDADQVRADVNAAVRSVEDRIAEAAKRFEAAQVLFGKVPGNSN